MIEKVVGYVDGQPVYYQETEPTTYETSADAGTDGTYEIEITATDDFDNSTTLLTTMYLEGSWIEPIWWRTQLDVDYANKLNAKISRIGWNNLSEQERTAWTSGLIGCLNVIDLNRIEQDTKYLSDILNNYAYTQNPICKTDWGMNDLPTTVEMNRLIENIQSLVIAYHAQPDTLPASMERLNFAKLNSLENILKLMKEMIHRMEDSFRYSGTFNVGQEVAL